MYPTYVPILKAKPGEFSALDNLKPIYSQKITPFFEIPKLTKKVSEAAYLRGSTQPKIDYLNKVCQDIIASCKSSSLFFDQFEWKPNVYTETGEHVYSYVFRKLSSSGLKIYPVIGLDRWGDIDYQNALRNLSASTDTLFCLRIDSETIEDAYDEEHFIESIENVMDELHLSSEQIIILFDFGDVTKKSIVSLLADMHHLLDVVKSFSFGAK
ncbi:beta family protein [Pantoea sp. NGS-ED-1003]|uniref:beta family protein n=1 Tax=Pantoea sp. NGS-ED-1003 TaxID=1526743 RepID=UPI002100BCFA|nr:beta family protein [Pantoea sp. NGS-ED-1003]